MKARPLSVAGAWEVTPVIWPDDRGLLLETFRPDKLAAEIGQRITVAQGNLSVSRRGVVRGVHFADVPPGQAKYVTCVRGAGLDVVVDIRVGSPTYGRYDVVRLDDVERRAVYISAGLGHAFCALEDDTALSYLCSTIYNPPVEHTVHALDPALDLPWPDMPLVLSPRDHEAPTVAEARERGLLPDYVSAMAALKRENASG